MGWERSSLIAACCLLASTLSPPAIAEAPLSLEQAIKLAAENSRGVRVHELATQRAEFRETGTLSDFGPRVLVDFDWRYWDDDVRLHLTPPDDAIAPTRSWIAGAEALVRRRNSWTASLSLEQPLTGLYSAWVGRQVASLELERAEQSEALARRFARLEAVEAWHAVARARSEVAAWESALSAARDAVAVARAAVAAGRAREDDVGWMEIAASRAEQGVEDARAADEVAGHRLALLVGRPADDRVELGPVAAPPGAGALPLGGKVEDAVEEALRARKDVAVAAAAVDAARVSRRLRTMDWVPRVDAMFQYARSNPTELLPTDSWYVGLVMRWRLWEWGKTWFAYRAAGTDLLASLQELARVKDRARLEVRGAVVAARTARAAVPRAASAAASARDLARAVAERLGRGEATVAEVRDANAAALDAELVRVAAGHADTMAAWKLAEAIGR
ncbi:MAG: TolC family protein [Deltaproteobacteria bacterium]|nr:TolC family protein [Deltaproteobacteria bacterium]